MNIQTPASRSADPYSSHDAEQHINKSGVRARQQDMTAREVQRYPGLTALELSKECGLCRYMLGKRLTECVTDKTVVVGTIRKCSISGRLAQTWYPAGNVIQFDMFRA